jgi:hypothetical protein
MFVDAPCRFLQAQAFIGLPPYVRTSEGLAKDLLLRIGAHAIQNQAGASK